MTTRVNALTHATDLGHPSFVKEWAAKIWLAPDFVVDMVRAVCNEPTMSMFTVTALMVEAYDTEWSLESFHESIKGESAMCLFQVTVIVTIISRMVQYVWNQSGGDVAKFKRWAEVYRVTQDDGNTRYDY